MAKSKDSQEGVGRPRGGPARSVSDLLPAVGGAAFRRFGFVQSAIVSRWAEIVGEKYAGVTAPESIRFPQGKRDSGTLNIVVAPAWAPMIQHVEPAIMERVNLFFGYPAVIKVSIRQGEVQRGEARNIRPELVPLPTDLGESLRTVADPELRNVLEAVARGVATKENASMPVIGKVR
jgi:hypothetical protein